MIDIKLTSFYSYLKARIHSLLFQNNHLPPEIFFSFILIKQFGLIDQYDTSYALFSIGLILFVLTCYNHFILYTNVLITHIGMLGPLNSFIGILNINQNQKLYLFWFSTGYYTLQQSTPLFQTFVIVFTIFFCRQVYNNLIFSTILDNISYFVGFFTLFCVTVLKSCIQLGSIYSLRNTEILYILPIILLVAYIIIKQRIIKIQSLQPHCIKNPYLIKHYINSIQIYLQKDENVLSQIFAHKKTCNKLNCFCQFQQEFKIELQFQHKKLLQYQLINYVYLQILSNGNWQQHQRFIIVHNYIIFQLKYKKIITASQMLCEYHENCMNYFNKCLNYRVKNYLKQVIENDIYFNQNQTKLKYIYEYDLEIGYVMKQIRFILHKKCIFWKELLKQNPIVKDLEIIGRQMVQKIQNLNQYFMLKVRNREDILNVYKCTIIYTIYLGLTTNYVQLANSLVKKIKKLAEQAKVNLRTSNQHGLFLRVTRDYYPCIEHIFQLTIVNATNSLTQILRKHKDQLLNKKLTQIIPDQFQLAHIKNFDKLFRNVQSLQKSNFIAHQQQQLPYKIKDNQVVFLDTVAELEFDILSGCVLVKCIINKPSQQSTTFIMNLDGDLILKQSDMAVEYANSEIILQNLEALKNQWQSLNQLTKKQDSLLNNDDSLSIMLQPIFSSFYAKQGKKPLIKVNIKGDLKRQQKIKTDNLIFLNNIANIEDIIQRNETDSQTSSISKKNTIQNVLATLMQSSTWKIQNFLVIILFMLFFFTIGFFLACLNVFNLWNIAVKQLNPIYTVYHIANMNTIFDNSISYNCDIYRTFTLSNQALPLFYKIFQKTPQDFVKQIAIPQVDKMYRQQKQILFNCLYGNNNEITELVAIQLQKTIVIQKSFTHKQRQVTTLQNLLGNYIVDIHLMTKGVIFYQSALFNSFTDQFYQFYQKILQDIHKLLKTNIIKIRSNKIMLLVFIMILMLCFIIPIWKFNLKNKKKHIQIFNLLAQLESKSILDQINKLQGIQANILNTLQQNIPSSKQNMHKNSQQILAPQLSTKIDTIYDGVKKITAEQLINNYTNKNKIKIRKRVGQIIIDDSNCDMKACRLVDWIIVIFLIFFMAIIAALVWHKVGIIDHVNTFLIQTEKLTKKIQNNNVGLLISKIFFDFYLQEFNFPFQGLDLKQWIKNWIVNYGESYTDFNQTQVQIGIKNCTQQRLICTQNYSEILLQSMLYKIIADSYKQYIQLRKKQKINPQVLQKARVLIYFAQQLNDKLSQIKRKQIVNSFIQLQKYSVGRDKSLNMINAIFGITVVIYSVFAVLYVIWVKKDYIREVTILSVVNRQMLYNNKRLDSFLKRIGKSY